MRHRQQVTPPDYPLSTPRLGIGSQSKSENVKATLFPFLFFLSLERGALFFFGGLFKFLSLCFFSFFDGSDWPCV